MTHRRLISASRAGRGRAFTMVELLTVIAIISILATLLMTALANGKKRSRRIVCTSNLRQLSLALNMYLDDYPRRPPGFELLTSDKYLSSAAVLLCPEDRTGNWGGLVQADLPGWSNQERSATPTNNPVPVRYSFLHPLPWEDWAWNALLERGPAAGVAACQLHGLGRPNPAAPSMRDYEGLVLRARRDGAVVRKQVFWAGAGVEPNTDPPTDVNVSGSFAGLDAPPGLLLYPWPFFTDELPQALPPPATPPGQP